MAGTMDILVREMTMEDYDQVYKLWTKISGFLSEVGGGVVTGFRGKDIVLVEDADGFDIPMPVRECVVIETDDYNIPTPASKAAKKKAEEQSAARMASAASKPVSSVLDSGRQIECPVQPQVSVYRQPEQRQDTHSVIVQMLRQTTTRTKFPEY